MCASGSVYVSVELLSPTQGENATRINVSLQLAGRELGGNLHPPAFLCTLHGGKADTRRGSSLPGVFWCEPQDATERNQIRRVFRVHESKGRGSNLGSHEKEFWLWSFC